MIERFNFYDLYAYLVPGLVMLAALWLPIGLVSGHLPPSDLLAVGGLLLAAYVVGIMLHEVASTTPWAYRRKQPSDRMLDEKDHLLQPELRALVLRRMASSFGLAVTKELRNPAFRVARTRLVHDRRGAYIEQFNGLHGMTRSFSLAAPIAFLWYAGWLSYAFRADALGSQWIPGERWFVALVTCAVLGLAGLALNLVAGLGAAAEEKASQSAMRWLRLGARWLVLAWLGLSFVAGTHVASRHAVISPQLSLLWAPVLGSLAAFLIFWRASSQYANSFAQEVYLALISSPVEDERQPDLPEV